MLISAKKGQPDAQFLLGACEQVGARARMLALILLASNGEWFLCCVLERTLGEWRGCFL